MQNMSVYIPLGQITYRENDPSFNVDKKVRKIFLNTAEKKKKLK